jgi:proline dehydrogenase
LSIKEDFYFGAKLVRGAYIEKERERAAQKGYEDPINPTYEATTQMIEKSLDYCMGKIKSLPSGKINIMVASHNDETVKYAINKMEEYNIKSSDRVICFGQLLGMCDYLSFNLSGLGHSVYKYVPYGPVEDVLPYLSRRATENKGIMAKLEKEKRLLLEEIKRRLKNTVFNRKRDTPIEIV